VVWSGFVMVSLLMSGREGVAGGVGGLGDIAPELGHDPFERRFREGGRYGAAGGVPAEVERDGVERVVAGSGLGGKNFRELATQYRCRIRPGSPGRLYGPHGGRSAPFRGGAQPG
jgi:hypothetical protein